MPWLSRSNSSERIERPPPAYMQETVRVSKNAVVTFIPAMIDGSCGTSPANFKQTPMRLLLDHSKILMRNFGYSMDLIRTMGTFKATGQMFGTWMDIRDVTLQVALTIVGVWCLIVTIPAFVVLPGVLFVALCLSNACLIAALSWPLKGERVVRSKVPERLRRLDEFTDERWVFINGSMTSHRQLRSQINELTAIFHRQCTGIHNRTNGVILDLLEFLLIRSLLLNSPVDTTLYSQLRDSLLNITVRKVIVLGHGTGAAILSSVLDRLHADLPVDVLSKLEIYTFGSAATSLSNPCLALDSPMNQNAPTIRADGSLVSPVKAALASRGYRTEDTERVIPHIEHYAHASDFFARSGILHYTRSVLDNRFCGRLFVFNPPQYSGFLFSQYLEGLFPQSMKMNGAWSILDEKVAVDIQTVEKREFTAQGVSMPLKSVSKRYSNGGSPSPPRSPRSLGANDAGSTNGCMTKAEKRSGWGSTGMCGSGMDSVEQARKSAKEAEGSTVRQLSRLWRYTGGQKPVGEGVSVMNGVGSNLNAMVG